LSTRFQIIRSSSRGSARLPVAVLGYTAAQLLGIDRIRPGMRVVVGSGPSGGQWAGGGLRGATLSPATMNQAIDPCSSASCRSCLRHNVHLYKAPTYLNVLKYLGRHGYTQWTMYQPGSRFWPFQWIEACWLFALAVILITATVGLVRGRAA
jgi:hypothetical protein